MDIATIDYAVLAQQLLTQAMGVQQKAVVSTTTNFVHGHGPGGLFSHPALERPVFSQMILPQGGLQGILPVKPALTTNPLYGIFTGVTATTGSEPTGVCDDPPYTGLSKLCMHQFVFGRYSRRTRVMELDAFGKLRDRADHLDLQFMGNPFTNGAGQNPNVPTLPGPGGADAALSNDIAKALFEFAVAWARDFARTFYTGNPTNNTAGGGYKEFYGVDFLINTGYRDAETGVVCPAADSYIKSFGNLDVCANNGTDIVDQMDAMWFYLTDVCTRSGLDPATWVIAMRPMLFDLLTGCWPCAYYTTGCTAADSTSPSVFATDSIRMRDDMRAGKYLMIRGVKVPVVLDDAIPETEVGAGVYRSSIYFVPMTVLGGTPVTYMEYFDYSTPNGFAAAAETFAPTGSFFVSDSGRFAWHRKPPTNWCVEMLAKTEPRLLLLTPCIAGRLTDVSYTPIKHERDWSPSGTYFVNGGNSTGQTVPSYYSPHA